ncbi:helix-turn-helix domain-containing protein [Bacteroides cellulosilyticus]|jgi:transcriptional regulator with XRE-family HTH domain|uniref:XRE family transcriptional regulator n=1 Tax=Bacteroides cellulosilyticus TaxID=246787 RepID=A0A412IA82_9BACE|nr:helix-turn-helix transcriptional regulator [Bacteroides cellulosilyticus]RGS33676.1 XRE family transcriptional regulator [Bacteroides cellulosilyticus]DAL65845.1 MAG TPA_asm: Repressor protein CI [Caudoviricetes sp.]
MDLRIKEFMSERNVTSAWLANKVGISKVAVSNIVTGKSSPSLDNIIKIADVLNVSIAELIGEEKNDNTITCPHCGKKIKIEKGE